MMSQHSNSLATATAAILVHNENLLRLCTKMAAVSMAKGCMQTVYSSTLMYYYPAPCMRSEGSSDCSWTGLYIYICKNKLKLKKYSLSEVHFNTGRFLFEFNGLQYRFVAGQVFVAFANHVSVSFW